jgi:hypothetical protein
MAIHESTGVGGRKPNRCQAALLSLPPSSTIPQTCEAPWISPKGVRRAKRTRFDAMPCTVKDFSLIVRIVGVISMYGPRAKGV